MNKKSENFYMVLVIVLGLAMTFFGIGAVSAAMAGNQFWASTLTGCTLISLALILSVILDVAIVASRAPSNNSKPS